MNDKSLGSQNTSCLRLLEMLTQNQNNDATEFICHILWTLVNYTQRIKTNYHLNTFDLCNDLR